ncbi:MAG: ABC transporter ATP-binding protein [Thermoprotei archaeon]
MDCITVKEVRKRYGSVLALDGLTFSVPCGERVALLGPNGAGKSTTLKILVGLLTPDEGYAEIMGHDPRSIEARKVVGYLPEDASPYPVLTVRENLEYIASLRGLPNARERVEEVLDLLELREYERRRVMSLSRGNRQKVALALALIHSPKVLLLDEPLNYLDIPTQEKVIRLLNSMEGVTALISTHIMSIATRLSTKVIVISRGKVIWQGSIDDLRAMAREDEPIESVVARLMEGAWKSG